MKIFSKNFKTIILSLMLSSLLVGNSKIFCMEDGVEFQVSDEELDDIELALDDGDGASTIEVEDDSVVVENNEKPKKEISKKRRFFVSLLKVAAIVVPAVVAFHIGKDIGYNAGNKGGGSTINEGDYLKMQNELGDTYALLDFIELDGGGTYKGTYYYSRNAVVGQMKDHLGEVREKLDELAGVLSKENIKD